MQMFFFCCLSNKETILSRGQVMICIVKAKISLTCHVTQYITHTHTSLFYRPERKPLEWRLAGRWRSAARCLDAECGFWPPVLGRWTGCSWSRGSPWNYLCHLPAHSTDQVQWLAAWTHCREGWVSILERHLLQARRDTRRGWLTFLTPYRVVCMCFIRCSCIQLS